MALCTADIALSSFLEYLNMILLYYGCSLRFTSLLTVCLFTRCPTVRNTRKYATRLTKPSTPAPQPSDRSRAWWNPCQTLSEVLVLTSLRQHWRGDLTSSRKKSDIAQEAHDNYSAFAEEMAADDSANLVTGRVQTMDGSKVPHRWMPGVPQQMYYQNICICLGSGGFGLGYYIIVMPFSIGVHSL